MSLRRGVIGAGAAAAALLAASLAHASDDPAPDRTGLAAWMEEPDPAQQDDPYRLDPSPADIRRAEGNPFLDFKRAELGAFVGVTAYSSDFDSNLQFAWGVLGRVPVSGLWKRLGIFAEVVLTRLDRSIDGLEEPNDTVLFAGGGLECYLYQDTDMFRSAEYSFLVQTGVVYGTYGDVSRTEDGVGLMVGAAGGLSLRRGYWLRYNPQFILGDSRDWQLLHLISFSMQF